MALRHVQPGTYRGFSAIPWNRFVDVANSHAEVPANAGDSAIPHQELITVRNDTGADVDRFRCLAIAPVPILVPGDDDLPAYRAYEPYWQAEQAVIADHWNRWCVPTAPIADGLTGLCVFRGITAAMVTFRHRHHNRVEPDPDTANQNKLRSCVGGIGRVLHSELTDDDSYPVDKLCLIELNDWPNITVEGYLIDPLDAVVIGTENATLDKSCARMAVYRKIWTDPATATSGGNSGNATDAISTTSDSNTVSIQATGHGLSTASTSGQHTITITGADTVGGINLTGTHAITAVSDANTVTVRSCLKADSTVSSDGGEIDWYINTPGETRIRVGQVELSNWSYQTGDPGTYCKAIWSGREWVLDWLDTAEMRNETYDPEDLLDLAVRTDGT